MRKRSVRLPFGPIDGWMGGVADTDLVFGWRTALLTVAIAQLLIIAAALSRSFANHTANRTLAVLLIVLAGIVTPWAIGSRASTTAGAG